MKTSRDTDFVERHLVYLFFKLGPSDRRSHGGIDTPGLETSGRTFEKGLKAWCWLTC